MRYIPYMTSPGNHEIMVHNDSSSFIHYKNRFTMPNHDSMWYSWNISNSHFISYSSETIYDWVLDEIKNLQINWLINDLEIANKPENK